MRIILFKFLPFFYSFLMLISCQEERIVTETPASETSRKVDIKGFVQKGPFINGTSIVIVELNDSLEASSKTFLSQVVDNKGSFLASSVEFASPYVQIVANGFYFDEVKGEKSVAQLTLYAVADTASATQINVNVLSHLEKDRVLYLVSHGKSFIEAKQQAQQEVLSIFGIAKHDMKQTENLDIAQQGEDNAILLAISVILQGDHSVGELSETLAEIISDIRTDGKLDNQAIITQLTQNAMGLDLSNIRNNVQERYKELGVETTIPPFEKYIDSDGDGILNKDDDNTPDEFAFEAVTEAERNTLYRTDPITIAGLPSPTIAKITNGLLLKNGQLVEDNVIYLQDGDQIQLQVQSPLNWGEETYSILQVGEYTTRFTVTNQTYPWASAISGLAQVGPFINGTAITLSEQDSLLTATSMAYTTKTTDDGGSYQISNVQVNYPWIQLEAKGYYFNMISGKNSEGELSLTAYTDISSSDKANINVLTYLESRRVKYLVKTGLTFTAAKQQAIKEILKIFEIKGDALTNSEHFYLTQSTEESATLIAISAILQGYENTGTLYSLLTNISLDLETDGKLDDEVLGSALVNNAFYLDEVAIRRNLINKYKYLGQTMQIPNFEKYIDNFKENTTYKLTKSITYPSKSNYGENILYLDKKTFKAGKTYSLSADLPERAKLKIKIKGGFWYYQVAPKGPINWSVDTYNYGSKSQVFTVIEPNTRNDLSFSFAQPGQPITIEYYEYGSTTPTRTKKVTITR